MPGPELRTVMRRGGSSESTRGAVARAVRSRGGLERGGRGGGQAGGSRATCREDDADSHTATAADGLGPERLCGHRGRAETEARAGEVGRRR